MNLASFAARNVLRNRFRTVLTVLGVAVAVVAFLLLRTVVYAWTMAADFAAIDRVVTRHKVTFIMTLPKRYVDDVRTAPGIKVVTFANWFGGKDPKHDTEFFSAVAVDTKSFFQVYDEMRVADADLERWQTDRSGAIVGDVLAKKLGWHVGDKVTLESGIYPDDPQNPWTFTIDGIYTAMAKSVDRSTFVFHWDRLNDRIATRGQNEVGWIVSRVDDPRHVAETSLALDRLFDDREVQTLSQDEGAFNASFLAGFSAVLRAIDVVSLVILVIMTLILGNTVAMGVRERTNEYGVLRAIGFFPRHIAAFVLGEAVVTGCVGGVLGIVLAYPLIERGMGRWLEENMGVMFPYFRIETSMVAVALGASVVLAGAAAAIPAWRASRLRVTDALRRVA